MHLWCILGLFLFQCNVVNKQKTTEKSGVGLFFLII